MRHLDFDAGGVSDDAWRAHHSTARRLRGYALAVAVCASTSVIAHAQTTPTTPDDPATGARA